MVDPTLKERLYPGGSLHSALLKAVTDRVKFSEQTMSSRYNAWNEAEDTFRLFRPEDEEDTRTKAESMSRGMRKIVVPYTYAVLQTMLAFFISAFTQRRPTIPVYPVGSSENLLNAQKHEALLDYQFDHMKGILLLYQWLFDTLRYGIGIVKNTWDLEIISRRIRTRGGSESTDRFGRRTFLVSNEVKEDVYYEGNYSVPVSPYRFYPDTRLPISRFQEGEFCGHEILARSRFDLLKLEERGIYFNVGRIPRTSGKMGTEGGRSRLGASMGMADPESVQHGPIDQHDKGAVDLIEMNLKLVPRDWELADRSIGETWILTVANKATVIRAEPAETRRFPFAVAESGYDAHSILNPGIIEVTEGLQSYLNFLFNSHAESVRRTIYNQFVIDPSMLEEDDIETPHGGRYLRLKEAYYGASNATSQAINQLQVTDVTASHLKDSTHVMSLIELVTAASRNLMGVANTGRRSAAEVTGAMQLGTGRLRAIAEIFVAEGFQPWAEQLLENNQDFLSTITNIKVLTEYTEVLGEFIEVSPFDLEGVYRVPVLDSGIPTDRQFTAQALQNMLDRLLQSPEVAAQFGAQLNVMEIFRLYVQNLGFKNVKQFMKVGANMQVLPDQQVGQGAQAGNLQPVPGGNGGSQPALKETQVSAGTSPPGPGPEPGIG